MSDPVSGTAPALPVRDRLVVIVTLGLLTLWAWAWLFTMPQMEPMPVGADMLMPRFHEWSLWQALSMFLMWAIMMVGMMIPSAAPMVLLYARVARRGQSFWRSQAQTWLFVSGYVIVWTAFSAAATAVQWALERFALLTPMMTTATPLLGGALLIAAGLYQFTSAKRACLEHCRGPLAFVLQHWRAGPAGALAMGLHHGTYCLGCCWALMALLFVVGVMNLLWVAIIAAFVLVEKVVPRGQIVARGAGSVLILTGAYIAIEAF